MAAHVFALSSPFTLDCADFLFSLEFAQSLHLNPHTSPDLANASEEAPECFPIPSFLGAEYVL